MEAKRDNFDKEIKQLQKARENHDTYMSDTEAAYLKKRTSTLPSGTVTFNPSKEQNDELKFIKGDNLTFKNDLKIVKFVENDDTNTKKQQQPTKTYSYSSLNNTTNDHQKKPNHISSLKDNLKKNISFDLETPSPLTQSLNNSVFNATGNGTHTFNSLSYNDILNESNVQTTTNQNNMHYTPSKTLRLEDFQFEKPNFSIVDEDAINQTINEQQQQYQHQQKSNHQLNVSLTPEFNDCLQLLNEAESKIQSRSSPYVSKYQSNSRPTNGSSYTTTSILKSSSILPDKYARPQQQSQSRSTAVDSYNNNDNTKLQYSPIRSSNSFNQHSKCSSSYENSVYNSSSYRSRSSEPANNNNNNI
jgi:hypothetical protein